MLVDASRIHAVVEEDEKVLRVISAAGDRFATLFGAYCEGRAEKNLKVWYRDSTVEEIFPSLHHRTFDIGFFYADQRQMIAYLQMIKRKHLEFTALGQTEPILYVGPQNPLYGAESVAERELKSLKYVQIQDFYNRPEMHLMEGGMDYLDYQNQRQVMVTNNRSLLTQIILTTSLANISSARFPDILTGSKDIHAIPIRGMKNRMTFAYVKRLHGDLPEEAKQFVEYVKAHII